MKTAESERMSRPLAEVDQTSTKPFSTKPNASIPNWN